MIITRKKRIPLHWAFYAQLPLILTIYGQFVINTPFLLMMKRFIDNPAAIMGLISIEIYLTILGGPFVAWLSDRIWTRMGRRKFFQGTSDIIRGFILMAMPFAPNLWVLIILRWLFGIVSDLGAPTQALAYEIVPPKQRGLSSGFKSAFMQIGNLVFFFLVIGRFDDVYFMGPFSHFMTLSGGSIMFWMCALILLGVAVFEFFGIHEIYPPARKRLREGRKEGENVFKFFIRAFAGDIFAKDLSPLYLLLFANLMFSFGLGMFQPLLFTEQWGYSLQDMGNTVAVGVLLGIFISLLAGWLADRTGKMRVFFWCTVGNLVVNLIYTAYVYFKPDFRPSLFEIILFGNLAYIFGATKGVISFPLLMEYVKRNRMGAAGAGITLFNGIFRSGIALLVGGWLFVWSWWLFPAAGYHVETHLSAEKDKAAVEKTLAEAGLDPEDFILRPMHQYGVDGETSSRWWIHRNDKQVHQLIKEREDLNNEISVLNTKRDSPLADEARRAELKTEIDRKRGRIKEIDSQLKAGARELAEVVAPAFAESRFQPGEQIRRAELSVEGDLVLEVQTIESLGAFKDTPHEELLEQSLQGPEVALRDNPDEDSVFRFIGELDVRQTSRGENLGDNRVLVEMQLDNRFRGIFGQLVGAGMVPGKAHEASAAILSTLTAVFGRAPGSFELSQASAEERADDASDAATDEPPGSIFALEWTVSANEEGDAATPEILKDALSEEAFVREAEVSPTGPSQTRVSVELLSEKINATEVVEEDSEEAVRLGNLGLSGADLELLRVIYPKIQEGLAARPVYVTVPRHEVATNYGKREYEYFFSSQVLQIATDVFGLLVLAFIIALEKRGTLHRYGVEEDENR